MKRPVLAFALAALIAVSAHAAGVATPFSGLADDSDKPIEISAETQQVDFNAETVVYAGDVRVRQGEMALRADKVTASAPGAKLSTIEAAGGVVITSRDATATAPRAVYDVVARTIRLTGAVVLAQGGNTLKGTDLLVDLKAGTAVLTGKGAGDGRVEGVLQPGG